MQLTQDEIFALIGQLYAENFKLRQQNAALEQLLSPKEEPDEH